MSLDTELINFLGDDDEEDEDLENARLVDANPLGVNNNLSKEEPVLDIVQDQSITITPTTDIITRPIETTTISKVTAPVEKVDIEPELFILELEDKIDDIKIEEDEEEFPLSPTDEEIIDIDEVEIDLKIEKVSETRSLNNENSSLPPIAPTIEIDENALVAAKDPVYDGNEPNSFTALPAVLIVIAVVVAVTLIAAVISVVLKSSFLSGSVGVPPHPPTPEQQYLNPIEPQRTAQIQW